MAEGLTLPYQTEVDPTLDHQVKLLQNGSGYPSVSCNCLRHKVGPRQYGFKSMGISPDIATSRALYNDPTNHDKPFTKEDRARW